VLWVTLVDGFDNPGLNNYCRAAGVAWTVPS